MDTCRIPENASKCSGNTMECFMVLSTQAQKISIGILCGLFGTMCVFENSLVLYLIFSSPGLRKKPSYLFIGSLALADILASIIFVCSFVNFHVFNKAGFSKEVFLLQLGGVNTSFSASLSSLLLTALDRYISISRPSEYKLLMTRKRAWTALAVLWVTCATIAYLPLLGWNCCVLDSACSELFPFVDDNYLSGWLCFTVVLLGCIIYAYAHVLWRARQHVAYMEKHQAAGREAKHPDEDGRDAGQDPRHGAGSPHALLVPRPRAHDLQHLRQAERPPAQGVRLLQHPLPAQLHGEPHYLRPAEQGAVLLPEEGVLPLQKAAEGL